jgi:hypothetical protein
MLKKRKEDFGEKIKTEMEILSKKLISEII